MNEAHEDLTVMCYEETGEINECGNKEVCGTAALACQPNT